MKARAVWLTAFVAGAITFVAQSQPAPPSSDSPGDSQPPADAQPGPPAGTQAGPPPGNPDQGSTPPGGDQPGPDFNGGGGSGGGETVGGRDENSVSRASSASRVGSRSGSGGLVTLIPPKANAGAKGDKNLRLNFRNAPLDRVLNYLSDAAGFVILLEAEVKGTVDVWSTQSLNKNDAVALLNTVLNKSGYGVIQDGHFLTVVSRIEAQRHDHPVKTGNNPADIPKNAQIVTQIIPVRSLNSTQLLKDLAPLLPAENKLTANEAGNSLIMTDTQINIHRVAELVKALDSVNSTLNSIHVYPLQYGDAKSITAVVKEVFPSSDSGSSARGNQPGGGGFPFPGGFGGPNLNANNDANSSPQKTSIRVLAVADETSNSVIASAPEDIQSLLCDLIRSLDVNVNEIAEMKVFPLRNADPSEMATLLSSLFPDDTSSNNNNNNNRFGGGPFGGGPGGGPFGSANQQGQGNSTSDRAKRKGKVLAVADARTASVVVNAAKSLMPGIGAIINKLDADPAKKQKVYIFSLQNADVADVQQVLADLFQSSGSANSASSQNNALSTRSTALQQLQNQSQSAIESSSTGAGSGGF